MYQTFISHVLNFESLSGVAVNPILYEVELMIYLYNALKSILIMIFSQIASLSLLYIGYVFVTVLFLGSFLSLYKRLVPS